MFIPAPFTVAKKKVKTIQIFLAEEWINRLVPFTKGGLTKARLCPLSLPLGPLHLGLVVSNDLSSL